MLAVLGAVALGVQIWALTDCLRTPAADFQRVSKRSKQFWGALTAVSTFFGFLYLLPAATALVAPNMGMLMIINLAGATVAGVYLADVRPALAEVRGRGRGNQTRGTSW
ncbi:DUF2516 domain-containing protein [Arthrobacter livingstonensis]|uniref:DUF2516 domain-containing protein n=1 Tax=Arthrobacter livingstonensis TaxID=670078 RepID=A0A2V5LGA5_9MICC|nr:DUF2516 domain-containing protein [Arthrobacter livingstonensis]